MKKEREKPKRFLLKGDEENQKSESLSNDALSRSGDDEGKVRRTNHFKSHCWVAKYMFIQLFINIQTIPE